MRKTLYVATEVGLRIAVKIASVDKGMEQLFTEALTGNVAQEDYQAIYIAWHDLLIELDDMIEAMHGFFKVKEGQQFGKHMLRAVRETKQGTPVPIRVNTETGHALFRFVGNLDRLCSVVNVLKIKGIVEIKSVAAFYNEVAGVMDRIQCAIEDLKKVVNSVRVAARKAEKRRR